MTIGLVNVGISWCFAYFQETLASGTMDDPSGLISLVDFKGVPTTQCVKILWECHLSKSLCIYIYLWKCIDITQANVDTAMNFDDVSHVSDNS